MLSRRTRCCNNSWTLLQLTIALVGQSGGGKSTLVDLIPRYYDVQEGEVTIDGINVKDLGIHDLRQLIGNVNQEAILFNDTFRNNISFGVEGATDQQIEEAAKIANAYDFITQSENGFETNIGDRGSRLSGGQRQRVSIARAILKNPPNVITSSCCIFTDFIDFLSYKTLLAHGETEILVEKFADTYILNSLS